MFPALASCLPFTVSKRGWWINDGIVGDMDAQANEKSLWHGASQAWVWVLAQLPPCLWHLTCYFTYWDCDFSIEETLTVEISRSQYKPTFLFWVLNRLWEWRQLNYQLNDWQRQLERYGLRLRAMVLLIVLPQGSVSGVGTQAPQKFRKPIWGENAFWSNNASLNLSWATFFRTYSLIC